MKDEKVADISGKTEGWYLKAKLTRFEHTGRTKVLQTRTETQMNFNSGYQPGTKLSKEERGYIFAQL
jgi:hypothetical protein